MPSPFGTAVVIADRRSGPLGRDADGLRALLEGVDLEFEIRPAQGPPAAEALARKAVDGGAAYVVAAGDDATISAVVNGMMGEGEPCNPEAVLGVIPVHSNFVRTFGLPQRPSDAVAHLPGTDVFEVDVGRILCTANGGPRSRWFVNVAEVGFGGLMVRSARSLRPLGRLGTLISFWRTLATFAPLPARVTMDEREYEGPVTNLIVANAQFVQDGRPVAPRAHPGDGKFDVLVAKGTRRDYVETLTRMPKGTHLPSPSIKEYQAATVEIAGDRPLAVAADGLALGETPARFELLPRALRLKI